MISSTSLSSLEKKVEFGKKMRAKRDGDVQLEMFWDGWNLAMENVMIIMEKEMKDD